LDYLETRGDCFAWRNNTGAAWVKGALVRFGKEGSGDVLGVLAGRFFAIETKSTRGTQNAAQRQFEADFVACGGLYILAKTLGEVVAALGPPSPRVLQRKRVFHGALE
jgi:hypothetical protein